METQRSELYIGAMVIAALVVLVLLTIQFSRNSLFDFSGTYRVAVRFEAAPGIALNAPVYKNGVKIGSVCSVQLVDDDRAVEVVLQIQRNRKIYTNETCKLTQSMIMSDSKIEFVRSTQKSDEPIETLRTDGLATIIGFVPTDMMSSFSNIEDDLEGAIKNVSSAASGLTEFIGRASYFIGDKEAIDEKQKLIIDFINKSETTLASISEVAASTKTLIDDPALKSNLTEGVRQFPEVMKSTREILAKGNTIFDDAKNIVDSVQGTIGKVDAIVGKVEPVVDTFAADMPKISDKMQKGFSNFESVTGDISSITHAVASGNGPIRQFLADETLYPNVQQVVSNAKEITSEVKPALRSLKPVLDNAQVITDKVARNPSVIISGLLQKQTPIKGAMPQWGDGLGSDGLTDYDMNTIRGGYYETIPVPAGRNNYEYPSPPSCKLNLSKWFGFGKKEQVVEEYEISSDSATENCYGTYQQQPTTIQYDNKYEQPAEIIPNAAPQKTERVTPPLPSRTPRIMPVPDVTKKQYQSTINTAEPEAEPQLVFTPENRILR
jgi:ABC-type transporter Mla subunit MlaD